MDNSNNGYLIEADAKVKELYKELNDVQTVLSETSGLLDVIVEKFKLIQKEVDEECS